MVRRRRIALRALRCGFLLALLAEIAMAATDSPAVPALSPGAETPAVALVTASDDPVAATPAAAEGLRDDLRAFARLPRAATPRAWGHFGLSLVAVGAVSAFDDSLRNRVRDHSTDGSMRLARDLRALGKEGGLVLLGGAWGLGRATDHPRLERIGRDGLEATVLAAGLLAPALKAVTGRARPRQGEGDRSFHPFGGDDSFPSGEATEAFAIAAVISTHAERRWVKATAWGLATGISVGRMELDAHWASDVTAGALLGAGVGRWVTRRHPVSGERAGRAWQPDLVAPAAGARGGMLYAGWSW